MIYRKQEVYILCACNVPAKTKYDQDMLMVQIRIQRKNSIKKNAYQKQNIGFYFILFLSTVIKKINIFESQLAWKKMNLETQMCIHWKRPISMN